MARSKLMPVVCHFAIKVNFSTLLDGSARGGQFERSPRDTLSYFPIRGECVRVRAGGPREQADWAGHKNLECMGPEPYESRFKYCGCEATFRTLSRVAL